jgi:hypothetical protein
VTQRQPDERFLRAAIKAGLRLQRRESCQKTGSADAGVATLQRIKASLRKHKTKSNP